MLKKYLLLSCLVFLSLYSFSQDNYDIKFIVKGLPDSTMYLGSYYGDKMKLEDTAFYDARTGEVRFHSDKELMPGVYFLINSEKKRLFEFVLDKDWHFTYKTDTSDYINKSRVENSLQNKIFLDYQVKTNELYAEMNAIQEKLSTENDNTRKSQLQEEIKAINSQNIEYKKEFIKNHPDHILSLILNTIAEPEIPDSLKGEDNDSRMKAYRYYKKHYWDKIDLSDERLLRTPVFHTKFENYFEKIIPKHPDSIIVEVDKILAASKDNEELFKYMLFEFTAKYEQSKIMGYDEIFVHMVDFYFSDTTYSWISLSIQQNMIERVEKIRPLLIGKTAPELILADTLNGFRSLYELENDYKIVIFWTTTCSECKKEIKGLKEIYQEGKYDIEIYAVNTDTSFSVWKDYLRKHDLKWVNVNGTRSISRDYHILYDVFKTPTAYILDKNFKIIAKHLSVEQIGAFLQRRKASKDQ